MDKKPKLLIKNADEQPWQETTHGTTFGHRRKNLTMGEDGMMTFSLYELPPGKANWPYHYHCANEEIFYILEGEGEVRTPEGRKTVRKGDIIRFPTGPDGTHQLINTGRSILSYIDVDTTIEPDVIIYPDSEKINIMAGSAPGQDKGKRYLHKVLDKNAVKDYWEGE